MRHSIILENIPAILRERKQWTRWRYEKRDGKRSKLPFQPDGSSSKANDPSTWCSFDEASEALQSGNFDGLGFFFSQDDPFVGIDLDNCLSESGEVAEWAQPFLDLESYAEISPSGRGIKIVAFGKSPFDRGRRFRLSEPGCCVEIYDSGRYFALTGQAFGDFREIREIKAECLQQLIDALSVESPQRESTQASSAFDSGSWQSDRVKRAIAYLAKVPDAISGEGGHDRTFSAVCICVRFGLSIDETREVMNWFNAEKCQPAWSSSDLEHKIQNGYERAMADGEFGKLLGESYSHQSHVKYACVDISGILGNGDGEEHSDRSHDQSPSDPGPIPEHLLRIPGFVSEVMDHCLAEAPYPSPALAFCGALSLLSYLVGRKVRDVGDNRPNIYLLALANSASGKDWPRRLNARILNEIGLINDLGEKFASGEGLQDALASSPSMLFQSDEIDGILNAVSKSKDARYEVILGTLLTMYSASASVYPIRRKAGEQTAGVIDQPHLTLFGTCTPACFYESLNDRLLSNGFFARLIIVEAGRRSPGQEARLRPIPERVLEAACYWRDFTPGIGNLEKFHPTPSVIEATPKAADVLKAGRLESESEYGKAEADGSLAGMSVWGRTVESCRKLSLLYAVSKNPRSPEIDEDAASWAIQLVTHQARRMLFMADRHVASNWMDSECLKLIRKLDQSPEGVEHSTLLKRSKLGAKTFADVIETLVERGDVVAESVGTPGRTGRMYRRRQGERSTLG